MGELRLARLESPLGPLTAAACARGLCLLEFGPPHRIERELRELNEGLAQPSRVHSTDLEPRADAEPDADAARWLDLADRELVAYFAGSLRAFTVPLHTPGTPWQRRVWDELLRIAYGSTTSYGALATRLGSPGAARAVGRANGQNRVAIIIPCHRVIESTGALRGYAGGLERKRRLLHLEAHALAEASGHGSLFSAGRSLGPH